MPTDINANPSSKSNPWASGGANEYAGNNAPSRPDKSTTGYYGDPGGNVVDRSKINRTKDAVSSHGSQAFPGGESTGSGF